MFRFLRRLFGTSANSALITLDSGKLVFPVPPVWKIRIPDVRVEVRNTEHTIEDAKTTGHKLVRTTGAIEALLTVPLNRRSLTDHDDPVIGDILF